jgi:hypothetical protein
VINMKTSVCKQHPHPYPIPIDRLPSVVAIDIKIDMNGKGDIIKFYCIKCGTILNFNLRRNIYIRNNRSQQWLRRHYRREIKEIKNALKKLNIRHRGEYMRKTTKNLTCPRCGNDEGVRDICPYDEDINDTITYCNCCHVCRGECAADI